MESIDFICKNLNPTLLFVSKKTCIATGISHSHDYIELTFLLDGECNYEINGQIFPVKKGDLLFINPKDTHTTIVTDKTNPPVLFAIGFTDIHLSGLNMPENTFKFADVKPVFTGGDDLTKRIYDIVNEILEEKANNLPGKYFYMHSCLIQLLLVIIRHFFKPDITGNSLYLSDVNEETLSVKGKKQIVENICFYMEEHYAEKISLEAIASNMYLSPIYISKLFKEEMGDSPINYLISIRLKKAASFLKDSNLTITEISSLTGYENTYYFSRLFKKKYGVSPKEFRLQ